METTEFIEIIGRDEDSKHQFKVNITNEISLSQEMVTFSNSGAGTEYCRCGIIRALKEYPDIDFVDDHDGKRFIVTILRKEYETN